MLPPKKNQAAREEGALQVNQAEEQKAEVSEENEKEEEEIEYKNVFEETVVQGKRKHFVPKGKQVIEDWLAENFEEKEGRKCPFRQVYDAYLQFCIDRSLTDAVTESALSYTLGSKFPKGFVVKEDSSLKGQVKDMSKTPKPRPAGVSQKYKIKEVIQEAFKDLNDPSDGVMFNTLRKHIMVKVPALQLDLKPKILLRGLEMGVYWRYVELVKGTGRAGKYRWYNPERKEEKKVSKKKQSTEKAQEEEKGDGGDKEGAEASSADSGQEEEVDKKQEEKENADSEETKPKTKKAKKKGKVTKKPKKSKPIVHSNPTTIVETFPLAFTFMSEPKEARVNSIVQYIGKHYDVGTEKIVKVLESGAEKGYWHLVQGTSKAGIYQLAVDEFDPTDDDDLIGKVINAIMASTDPKTCSARTLKEYLVEFHPDYKIIEKPYKFKKALERALDKGVLRQLTGIGASGTFQLLDPFVPSPVILAGKDTASDYEEESSDEEELFTKSSGAKGEMTIDVASFQDAYKPRPSKRRGMARLVAKTGGFNKNAAYFDAKVKQETVRASSVATPRKRKVSVSKQKPQKQQPSKSKGTPKKRARYYSSSDDDERDEAAFSEDDSTYGSEGEKYRPRPSTSRGGSRSTQSTPKAKTKPQKGKASKSKTPSKKATSKAKPSPGKKSHGKKSPAKAAKKTSRKSRR